MKHEEFVEEVKKLFTKLSSNPITTSELVAKEPSIFTGSEVCFSFVRVVVVIIWAFNLISAFSKYI